MPLLEVAALDLAPDPLVAAGPVDPGCAVIMGAFWCTREIELALALRSRITVRPAKGLNKLRVSWLLPCTKSDPSALGKTRFWECVCSPGVVAPCPACLAVSHLRLLDARFGDAPDLPLFPSSAGQVVSKAAMVATIEAVASRMELPLFDAFGNRLFGGHTLRVTGAQHMASIGVTMPCIQLLARWDSAVVLRYVAEAPLEALSADYRRSLAGPDLEDMLVRSRSDLESLRRDLEALSKQTQLHFESERELRALTCVPAPPVEEFVVSVTDRVHRVLPGRSLCPPASWKTYCGWPFALSPHTLSTKRPTGRVCKACFKSAGEAEPGSNTSSSG